MQPEAPPVQSAGGGGLKMRITVILYLYYYCGDPQVATKGDKVFDTSWLLGCEDC